MLLLYVHLLSGFIFIFLSHSLQGNVLCIIDILPLCNCLRHVHDIVNKIPVIDFVFDFY